MTVDRDSRRSFGCSTAAFGPGFEHAAQVSTQDNWIYSATWNGRVIPDDKSIFSIVDKSPSWSGVEDCLGSVSDCDDKDTTHSRAVDATSRRAKTTGKDSDVSSTLAKAPSSAADSPYA
jgi:hypothetical protein